MDQVIIDYLNSVPEPGEGIITRVPPDVYLALVTLAPEYMTLMHGIDVYAYSSMITYVDVRYTEFPNSSITYCRSLLSNYLDALTSMNQVVMYLLFNSDIGRIMDKFRLIIYWNWINTNTLFRQTILPAIEVSTIVDDTINLEQVELSFRARYPY